MNARAIAPEGFAFLPDVLRRARSAWFPDQTKEDQNTDVLRDSISGGLDLYSGGITWVDENGRSPRDPSEEATWERLRRLLASGELSSILITRSGRSRKVPADVWRLPALADADWSGEIECGETGQVVKGPVFIRLADLNDILTAPPVSIPRDVGSSASEESLVKRSLGRAKGTTTQRRFAEEAIAKLYPNGLPPRTELTNRRLQEEVNSWLRENRPKLIDNSGNVDVKRDSILRAAGRRK
jgi:hypothetical protein